MIAGGHYAKLRFKPRLKGFYINKYTMQGWKVEKVRAGQLDHGTVE